MLKGPQRRSPPISAIETWNDDATVVVVGDPAFLERAAERSVNAKPGCVDRIAEYVECIRIGLLESRRVRWSVLLLQLTQDAFSLHAMHPVECVSPHALY